MPSFALAQNLINNPGFETAPAAGGNKLQGTGVYYAQSVGGGAVTVNNWTFSYDGTVASTGTSAAQIEWFKNGTNNGHSSAYTWDATSPHGGTYAIELNTDAQKGRMYAQPSLNANLTVGATYLLSFWVSPENNWFTGSSVTSISGEVTVDGVSVFTYTVSAPVETSSSWTQESFMFTATSANPVIKFYDGIYDGSGNSSNYDAANGSGNDINLDDFSLTLVPEPRTCAMAFLLLAAIAWIERKRLNLFRFSFNGTI